MNEVRLCTLDNCTNKHTGRGLCRFHYDKWRRHDDPKWTRPESLYKKHHREYFTWAGMIQRCENKNTPSYKHYGGRGIRVCARWRNSFRNFLEDMGPRPSDKYSIERINNDGNYEPNNCRWATRLEQILNRRINCSNTSGHVGVSYDSARNKWRASIKTSYKAINLGRFDSLEDALNARKKAEKIYF